MKLIRLMLSKLFLSRLDGILSELNGTCDMIFMKRHLSLNHYELYISDSGQGLLAFRTGQINMCKVVHSQSTCLFFLFFWGERKLLNAYVKALYMHAGALLTCCR